MEQFLKESFTIARVLLVSPEQSELFRRNRSRVFITFEGESLIDAVIHQMTTPIENFAETAARAIAAAGLNEDYGDMKPMYGPAAGSSSLVHLVTETWLKNEANDVFDVLITLDPVKADRSMPPVTMLNALPIFDSPAGENPMIMTISSISNLMRQDDSEEIHADKITGGQGRVVSEMDGRLKNNRDQGVVLARRDQDRIPGARGRVVSKFDRRLKANRLARQAPESSLGRPDAAGSVSGETWADGTPRTIPSVKKDGSPRIKPGPRPGAIYAKRSA